MTEEVELPNKKKTKTNSEHSEKWKLQILGNIVNGQSNKRK